MIEIIKKRIPNYKNQAQYKHKILLRYVLRIRKKLVQGDG